MNIPVAFPDPARGMMMNADFVKVVEASFPHDKKIIVGCQAGPRSNGRGGIAAAGRLSGRFQHARWIRRHARPDGHRDRAGLGERQDCR